ncbi:MAG: aminodeoxychorismate synthase component I [Proteobacteria bacterium]|nr:aminodeoxychorismate synthase component I [Pseudomonadota bacterium]
MIVQEIKGLFSEEDFIYAFGKEKGFFLLDSGDLNLDTSNFSFIGIRPLYKVYYSRRGTIQDNKLIKEPFLKFIDRELSLKQREKGPFPFCSGFIGYLTYDFGWELDKFRNYYSKRRMYNMPLACFYYYDTIFVVDKGQKKLFYVTEGRNRDIDDIVNKLKTGNKSKELSFVSKTRSSVSRKRYCEIIKKTKEYISAGDIYQANISQRFSCDFISDSEFFYGQLRKLSPAPFGAYFVDNDYTIISNSPERFLYRDGDYIETRPIKGTRKRLKDPKGDLKIAEELKNSQKDRAEHVMIVDLERNDLGKICKSGTVKVKDLMRIETYANVHHMVSTICGSLKQGITFSDCINATFPGGSITGAPKLRSMQIIDELEPVDRGIYCGSIGYIDNSGNFDFNIAIRTGIIHKNRLYFYVGGGIVADSDPELEYEETIIKARSFLTALGIGRITD